jgi:hypothetical protein
MRVHLEFGPLLSENYGSRDTTAIERASISRSSSVTVCRISVISQYMERQGRCCIAAKKRSRFWSVGNAQHAANWLWCVVHKRRVFISRWFWQALKKREFMSVIINHKISNETSSDGSTRFADRAAYIADECVQDFHHLSGRNSTCPFLNRKM